ncbi:MAG TPA: hypothetical protein VE735_06645, partial [Gammaproteobacteria bacterium]|nr:hypothetical protein [Gammaproteobacteria bacterium]
MHKEKIVKYEPYNLDSLNELLRLDYGLGWYHGKRVLFDLKCEGAFEGFSGRASKRWKHRFVLTSNEIQWDGKIIWPKIEITGETIEEV